MTKFDTETVALNNRKILKHDSLSIFGVLSTKHCQLHALEILMERTYDGVKQLQLVQNTKEIII